MIEGIQKENTPDIYEKPTIEQMVDLNRLGVRMALDQGKMRRSPKVDAAHIFLANEHIRLEESDEQGIRYSTQRFVGRIAKVGFQRWSMRIAESYWIRGIDDEEHAVGENQDGYRTSYMFEWSRAGVMYAKKHVHVLYKDPVKILMSRIQAADRPFDLDELVEEVFWTDVLKKKGRLHPQMLFVSKEIERVSRADCDLLISDIAAFGKKPSSEMV